jgi:hypothetical protein
MSCLISYNQESESYQIKLVKLTGEYPDQQTQNDNISKINNHYAARANKSYNCRHNLVTP